MNVGRLAAVVLWLFSGHLLLGGVYWTLLGVPDSNVLMLSASALLALVLVVGAGVIDTTGLLWLRREWTWRRALARSVRMLPVFLLAVVLWLCVHAIAHHHLGHYHELHRGELDAWLIATFDWTRTAWLHRTIDYVLSFVDWVIGISLAVSLLSVAATSSAAEIARLRWIPRGLGWKPIVTTAVALYGLVWLPWQWVYWRPASLPATSAEVIFLVAKLAVLGLLMHLGWALVLWAPQQQEGRAPEAAPPMTAPPAAAHPVAASPISDPPLPGPQPPPASSSS